MYFAIFVIQMPKPFKIKLSVPEPCKEDWDKMTPAEKGRYCSHCNKSVIDFSTYTDRELLDFFAKAKGHICGSFQNFQLDRLIVKQAPAATPMYRKLLYVTALAAGVAGTAYSQSSPNTVTKNQIDSKKSNNGNKAVLDSTYQISGTVVDSASGRPVPFVAMVIQHNGKQIRQTSTDGNGKFVFMLNKNYIGSHLTIFIENLL